MHLFDVNVLIALVDRFHPHHESATSFFEKESGDGWATCPLTENGFLRIIGHPNYLNGPGSPALARQMLDLWRAAPGHQFWPDDLSLCDPAKFPALPATALLTDVYLLALAVAHGGKFVTFDRRIDPALVPRGKEALLVLE